MRVAGYVRVSSRDQVEGYSIDAQMRAIGEYCASRGWDVAWYEEAGRSAWTDEVAARPAFAAMLAAARAGEVAAVVVHKLDRFARSLMVTLAALRGLERSNVAFVSLSEQMDFSTPIGRVILATLAGFAEYYSANLSAEVRKGLREKQLSGGHVGPVPYGAVRDARGRLAVDPERADELARFLDVASRYGSQRAAGLLNAEGIAAKRGGVWRAETVLDVVRGGGWLLEQPAPWPERWCAARDRPRRPTVRAHERVRLLSGLMRCACGGRLSYQPQLGRRRDDYTTCRDWRRRARGSGCPKRRCGVSVYHQQVEAWLLGLPDLTRVVVEDVDTAAAREALAERRRRLGLALVDGMISEEEYRRRKITLDVDEASLPRRGQREIGTQLRRAQEAWPELTDEARNAVLRSLLREVVIDGRLARPVPLPDLAALLGRVSAPVR